MWEIHSVDTSFLALDCLQCVDIAKFVHVTQIAHVKIGYAESILEYAQSRETKTSTVRVVK